MDWYKRFCFLRDERAPGRPGDAYTVGKYSERQAFEMVMREAAGEPQTVFAGGAGAGRHGGTGIGGGATGTIVTGSDGVARGTIIGGGATGGGAGAAGGGTGGGAGGAGGAGSKP